MVLDTVNLILAIIVSAGTIITTTALGVRWLVKHYLTELKPNSGSSMKDQVNRLEFRMDNSDAINKETYTKVERLELKVDAMYDKIIDYLSKKDN